jgi:outer membrane protein insertion porin family
MTTVLWLLACGAGAEPRRVSEGEAEHGPIVADVILRGVVSVDESELRRVLSTRKSPRLPWGDTEYFDEGAFAEDLERIVMFYAERGYPHARVVDSDVTPVEGAVVVTITIEEGNPRRIDSVQFSGFDVLGDRRLRALQRRAPLEAGSLLAEQAARETAQLAVAALGDAGYPYAEVDVRAAAVGPDRFNVDVHAEPGPLGYFGPIEIAGNLQVEDEVIRRHLVYLPGQPFHAAAMRTSQRLLLALGLFESVSIEIVGTERAAAVPTRITVKEADLNQISYALGYGTEEQLSAEGQWRHLNFLGGGRTTRIRGRWSSIDRGGEGTFLQPYFFTPRLSLQVSGHMWEMDEPLYTATVSGGGASISYARSAYDRWTAGYLQEHTRARLDAGLLGAAADVEGIALGLDSADGTQSGMLGQVALDYARDTTPEAASPRNGHRVNLRLEKAGGWLPGSFDYYNVFASARYYVSLGPMTLAGRVQAGSIVPRHDSRVPFSRRYFLGGADTLRGWGRLEVGPQSSSGAPIGGESMAAANLELRMQIARALATVVFLDAGNVWTEAWQFQLGDLRSNAGGGIRIESPFGLLRLDAGYQLTPLPDLRVDGETRSRRWRLHFSIGQAF